MSAGFHRAVWSSENLIGKHPFNHGDTVCENRSLYTVTTGSLSGLHSELHCSSTKIS